MTIRLPPDLKTMLIQLNLEMDVVLHNIARQNELAFEFYPNFPTGLSDTATTLGEHREKYLVKISAPVNSLYWAAFPTHLESYVLHLEDRYFLSHAGFDVRCIPRVLKQALLRRRLGGVSTIEQQLVRTVLNRRERTFRRKFYEILLASILTCRASKEEILRAYLSVAYFGYKLRGCDEASRFIFNCDASHLVGANAAFLASLLVYPLPKHVQHDLLRNQLLPTGDAENLLVSIGVGFPEWSSAVVRRMRYGLRLAGQTK